MFFFCPRAHQTTLPDQEGPSAGSMSTFELMSSKDLAYQMTMFDWELFSCVHEVRNKNTKTISPHNQAMASRVKGRSTFSFHVTLVAMLDLCMVAESVT